MPHPAPGRSNFLQSWCGFARSCGRGPRGLGGPLLVLLLAVTCTSPSVYTRGPMPTAALPPPAVRLTRTVPGLGAEIPAGSADVEGTVTRLIPGGPPAHGFKVEVKRPDRSGAALEVKDYLEPLPDLAAGARVRLKVRTGVETEVLLADATGPVFYLFSGPTPPADQRLLPVQVRVASQRAYTEVRTSEDICQWTWTHSRLAMNVGGAVTVLAPGESAVLKAQGDRAWWVAAIDARTPEESTCGAEGEPRVSYVWMRVARTATQRP